MIRQSPVTDVIGAIVTALRAHTGVSALVETRVYNHVPQSTAYPYVEVTSPTDRRVDTMSRFGAELIVNVKAVSQGLGDKDGARVMDACIQALNFAALTLATHASLGVTWDTTDRYSEAVNGIVTRYHVGIFRVWTEQTS